MVPRIFLTALLLFAKRYEVSSQRCEYFPQPALTTTSYIQPAAPYIFPTSIKQAPACDERRIEHPEHNSHSFSPVVYREDDDNDIRNLLYYFLLFALTKSCGCSSQDNCGHQMSYCSNGGYGEGYSGGCSRGSNCRGGCGSGGECCCCGKCRSGKDRGRGGGFGEGFGSGGGCCCCGKCDCYNDCGCNGGHGYGKWDDYCTCGGGHGVKDEYDIFNNMKNGVVYIPYPIPFPCGCQEHKMCSEDKVVLHGPSGNCNEANEINLIIKTDC